VHCFGVAVYTFLGTLRAATSEERAARAHVLPQVLAVLVALHDTLYEHLN
jgi:hypothetical protein